MSADCRRTKVRNYCERPDDRRDERSFIDRHGLFTFDLSCPSLLHFAHAQQMEDGQNRIRYYNPQ
jgi:hypothetical protein